MLRSLRFQLPALFLLGVVVAGLVSAAIALRLFRQYAENRSREQAYAEVGREAKGLTQIYAQQAGFKLLSAHRLELATGDQIFYHGVDLFPGPKKGPAFRPLPKNAIDLRRVYAHPRDGVFFVFRPPNSAHKLLAAARPIQVGKTNLGAIVVAKPETVLSQRWGALVDRLLIAFAGGVLVAAAFAWYLSRRITTPVLQLTQAADEVARGTYDVDVPEGGAGEIGDLADSFRKMASRLAESEALERNFLMTVTHELRTPLTAIRGHVEALREGVVTDEEMRLASLTVIAAEADRLERLVGDVLDLAKLDAHRFTVLREEVVMGAPSIAVRKRALLATAAAVAVTTSFALVASSPPAGAVSGAVVSAGGLHSCVAMPSQQAFCWGYNAYGQLGDGSTINRSIPVAVVGL